MNLLLNGPQSKDNVEETDRASLWRAASMNKVSSKLLERLVKRCQQGDKKAWQELIEVVSPLIVSTCRLVGLSREESYDVFGHVCYTLLRRLKHLKSAAGILAYAKQTAQREAWAVRQRAQAVLCLDNHDLQTISAGQSESPESLYEQAKRHEMLMKAVAQLPERDQQLIRTLFLERDRPDYQEASQRIGIPVASIGPTRARCLQKLHRILKRQGYGFHQEKVKQR